jgi:hypothetical protein
MVSNPEAIYDILFLGVELQRKLGDFSQSEVHFLAYFACLMSFYDDNSHGQWNYSFIKNELGSPFSAEIQTSFDALIGEGSIEDITGSGEYFTVSDEGRDLLNFLQNEVTMNSWRTEYLSVACEVLGLLPIGQIREAIKKDPVLQSASFSRVRKNLLEDSNPATQVLLEKFSLLKKALGDYPQNLLMPAIVWLESLIPSNEEGIPV